MPDLGRLQEFLAGGHVDAAVFGLRPDYRAMLLAADAGVTCRRWNWRQARRTQLRDDTSAALFILDALDPVADEALHSAADDLADQLARLGPGVRTARRLITAATTPG